MKIVINLFIVLLFATITYAGYYDAYNFTNDGLLSVGEHTYSVEVDDTSVLTVNGGGANSIDMKDNSHLEILSTSLPLNSTTKGVWWIGVNDNASLIFSGGATNHIAMKRNATALLTGGQINMISSLQTITGGPHIVIDCQKGWSLAYQNNIPKILYGKWHDGTPFEISFINDSDFPPVFDNIKIIPEPASMFLLGLGGVLINKRRRQ